MEYSTLKPWQEVGETGIIYDIDSLYGRFQHICDPRGAKVINEKAERLI